MPPRPAPSRIAQALEYLQGLKSGVGEFVGGVGTNLADRARAAGGLAYEALTSDPYMGQMNTAEFSEAAANRQTPRLDQAARDIGTIGKAILTRPVQTGKAIVRGEVDRAKEAMTSPQAAGQYAGSFIDPTRLAAALRHRAPIAELDVYHGTPHRFPGTEANPLGEFDASKIGTGEGAQAYGHGLYLAESPEVATDYQKNLQTTDTLLNGKKVLPNDPAFSAATKISARGYDAALAETRRDMASEFLTPQGRESAAKLYKQIQELKGAKIKNVPSGSLYKADLPDEMIDRMLDWDKPLSEQHPEVQRIIGEEIKRIGGSAHTGERAYRELMFEARMQGKKSGSSVMKNNLEANEASKRLQELGIPGIKYADAGSRGQGGSGTRNFVVFPGEEKKVRILERNGQPAPERIAQALEAAPQDKLEKGIDRLTTSELEDSQIFSKPLPAADATDLEYVGKVGASPLGRGGMHVSVRGSVRSAGPHEFFFHNDNDEPIGFARMTKGLKEASINMIALTDENRGQGLGKAFYQYLLDDLGVAVKSDKEITPNTADLYRSLAREYPSSVDSSGRIVINPKIK